VIDIIPQLIANSLISGSIYALVSLGLCLTYGLLKVLNFAHGHFLTVGAYLYYAILIMGFAGNGDLIPLLTTSVGCIFGMLLLGYLTMKAFVFPLLGHSTLLPFVSTMALATILESAVSMVFGVNVKSLSTGIEGESIEIASALITPVQLIIIISTLVILFLVAFIVHTTSFGRTIRALSQNPKAAQSLGVNRSKISQIVFAISSVVAGYAGIMVGLTTNVQPTMGNAYTIKAFAAMILGGLGNVWGTVCGSYLLGFIENFSLGIDIYGVSLPSGYKDAFAFVIILGVLLIKPEGLFSFRRRKV
jgi:branched-chain amino acid transport system permease protein